MGARLDAREDRFAPFTVTGSPLQGIEYALPVASAQIKSCVLLAGLLASGETAVIEPEPSRDHTERLLLRCGVTVERDGARIAVCPQDELELRDLHVPGDPSSAAFHIAAAVLVPGSRIVIEGMAANWTRVGFLRILERMGAVLVGELEDRGRAAVARRARHRARRRPRRARRHRRRGRRGPAGDRRAAARRAARLLRRGRDRRARGEELRVKETDRIATVVDGLRGLGAEIEATADGFAVQGTGGLRGGTIASTATTGSRCSAPSPARLARGRRGRRDGGRRGELPGLRGRPGRARRRPVAHLRERGRGEGSHVYAIIGPVDRRRRGGEQAGPISERPGVRLGPPRGGQQPAAQLDPGERAVHAAASPARPTARAAPSRGCACRSRARCPRRTRAPSGRRRSAAAPSPRGRSTGGRRSGTRGGRPASRRRGPSPWRRSCGRAPRRTARRGRRSGPARARRLAAVTPRDPGGARLPAPRSSTRCRRASPGRAPRSPRPRASRAAPGLTNSPRRARAPRRPRSMASRIDGRHSQHARFANATVLRRTQVHDPHVRVRPALAVALLVGGEVAAAVRVHRGLGRADAGVRADAADVQRLHPPAEARVLLEALLVGGPVVDPEDPQLAVHERGRPVAARDLRLRRRAQRQHRQHREPEPPHAATPTGRGRASASARLTSSPW